MFIVEKLGIKSQNLTVKYIYLKLIPTEIIRKK